MSTVRTSNGLHSQLEEFLSEVDSINPLTNDHAVETGFSEKNLFTRDTGTYTCVNIYANSENNRKKTPGCEWIVRLDPITKSSTYHHIRSGEISSVMPEEYKRYLSTFDAFLCGSDDEAVNLQQTNSDLGPTLSSPRTRQNSTKKNESSEQPTSGLDGLSGIIGYGDSSETDSDPESKSRSVTVTEIHEITHTPDQSSGLSLSASSPVNHLPDSASQDQSFIGPTLPPNRLSATERSPSPTWVCQNQQHKPKKSALEASARTLLDQFTALELNSDSLDALRTRYIQLMTRFEDWLCGKLSSNYFWQKLREAEAELRNYAASSLPRPWSCHWDRYARLPCFSQWLHILEAPSDFTMRIARIPFTSGTDHVNSRKQPKNGKRDDLV
ncbi:formin-binding protein 4 [Clonorchis sinensis]|uniref:Formin-binding protein 4 n=1 Tax=Clonorchis sinensis TaxID=79923 RepID=H2KU11_CLOSI|nr:formin-binding protein 4 [Clonorchis sinensis]